MAAKFDVAARLAEARQAVDDTQSYVWASHLLGYQNPDLTLHPAQVRDWFSSEDGMDLRVLDADSSAVQAAAAAADDALARHRDQLAGLTAAWQGAGAASAEEFLRRHCDSAENVATGVRTAAESLAGLRDTLWQIVDTKVAALTAIDDRRRAERPVWLAAAQTVTTGAGDRSVASELVDQQVKPFVDNDIRNDWLTTVRTAIASIGDSYDAATAGMISGEPVRFDVPGDLGPASAPPRHDDVAAPRDSAQTASAATAPSPSAPSPPTSYPSAPAMSAPAVSATPAGVPTASAAPAPTTLPATPSGGLEGLSQPVADALRGLLPSSGDGPLPAEPVPPTVGDLHDDAPVQDEDADKTDDENDCDKLDEQDQRPATSVDDATPAAEAPPPQAPSPEPPAPEPPPPEPPPPEPPPPDAPPTGAPGEDASTPCEIAASELPQAGQ